LNVDCMYVLINEQKRRIKVCQSLDLESPETSYSDIQPTMYRTGRDLYWYLYSYLYSTRVDMDRLHVFTTRRSYSDILQRLVRRYLFKLERQKDEGTFKFAVYVSK